MPIFHYNDSYNDSYSGRDRDSYDRAFDRSFFKAFQEEQRFSWVVGVKFLRGHESWSEKIYYYQYYGQKQFVILGKIVGVYSPLSGPRTLVKVAFVGPAWQFAGDYARLKPITHVSPSPYAYSVYNMVSRPEYLVPVKDILQPMSTAHDDVTHGGTASEIKPNSVHTEQDAIKDLQKALLETRRKLTVVEETLVNIRKTLANIATL